MNNIHDIYNTISKPIFSFLVNKIQMYIKISHKNYINFKIILTCESMAGLKQIKAPCFYFIKSLNKMF